MVHFLPPVLMGEARQQQQVVLCWDTRTTQPCTPLVTGVCVWGRVQRVQSTNVNFALIVILPQATSLNVGKLVS